MATFEDGQKKWLKLEDVQIAKVWTVLSLRVVFRGAPRGPHAFTPHAVFFYNPLDGLKLWTVRIVN
jgi:hypothetical protein